MTPRAGAAAAAATITLCLAAIFSPALASAGSADPWGDLAVDLLRRYLRIDTTNPPGNEVESARFLRKVLEKEGIEAEVDEFEPGRANLYARLRAAEAAPAGDGGDRTPFAAARSAGATDAARTGGERRGALALMHHMDVVPADPSRWSVDPFAAELRDGVIYGRGTQDTKTEGIVHLVALIRARRERLPLSRDIVYIATADEEEAFKGGLRLTEQRRDILEGVESIVTEGGDNLRDADGRVRFFGIDVAEKGPLWLTLRAAGTPGHGSRPIADSALDRLIRALERIRTREPELKVLPVAERFLRDMAPSQDPPRSRWFPDIRAALKNREARRALVEDREVFYLLSNTVSITVVRAGYKTNVIPGTAEAELDVRLLPGEDPRRFLDYLRKVIDDPTIEIVVDQTFRPPNSSPWETDLVRAAAGVISEAYPGVPVTAKLLSGATECVLYRPLGIDCYGFTPLLSTLEESASGHGDDERIREDTVRESTRLFYEFVRRTCQSRE
jgi:acetylornithine deacetylase/succinyl-diaminopimelate desuccinylase-like protein